MAFKRSERVGPLICEELSEFMLKKLSDPRLAGVTFTRVNVTADLKIARVYFSRLGSDEEIAEAAAALAGARKLFKRTLRENLDLRYLPELEFHHDRNPAYADRIERLLQEIHSRTPKPDDGRSDE